MKIQKRLDNEKLTHIERAKSYNAAFKKYPPLVWTNRWIYGIWMIGNDYRSKHRFYGEYPPTYLKRIMSMFPDINIDDILHLFSGVIEEKGIKFDINQDLNPDVIGNAEKLSEYFDTNTFELVLADPPYSQEDANHYGSKMINRNKVLKECYKILKNEGFVVWLDQILPMYSKKEFSLIGTIGIVGSTNHRFRLCSIFQKIVE